MLFGSIPNRTNPYSLFCLQRDKKNLQDLNGVFVFNVAEREYLDRPTARLIKEFDCVEGKLGCLGLLFFFSFLAIYVLW